MKFYICNHCKNEVVMVVDKKVVPMCCGEPMKELKANTTDAAQEKHVPVVTIDGDVLTAVVGSVEHPMLAEHYIEWICVEMANGFQIKYLTPGAKPELTFNLGGEKPVAVYEYCNLHGLWKKEL